MTTIYHVTRDWDGGDLRSLAQQMDDGDISLDDGLVLIAAKWADGSLRKAEEYLDGDGHEVHCCATLAEAIEFRDEFCPDGTILAIDADDLDVTEGLEYPHPVVRDRIPAERVRVVTMEVA